MYYILNICIIYLYVIFFNIPYSKSFQIFGHGSNDDHDSAPYIRMENFKYIYSTFLDITIEYFVDKDIFLIQGAKINPQNFNFEIFE